MRLYVHHDVFIKPLLAALAGPAHAGDGLGVELTQHLCGPGCHCVVP